MLKMNQIYIRNMRNVYTVAIWVSDLDMHTFLSGSIY